MMTLRDVITFLLTKRSEEVSLVSHHQVSSSIYTLNTFIGILCDNETLLMGRK